jgi:inward rectifier potassium channel
MSPDSVIANIMVSVEALIGLIGLAMVTGLVFSKFSRPTARVRFSSVAIVSNRDGIPSFQFRMANMRANRIVDASARVVFARQERTMEGEEMRRFYDLKLQRDRNAIFIYSWTAIHPITDDSPINGVTREAMESASAEIIVSVTGLDETFAQTIHARHSYRAREILWGRRFVDILERNPDGTLSIDYTHFDDVVAIP